MGHELAKKVPPEIEDIGKELAEDYTVEDVDIILEKLMREMEETSLKMDENLKRG